MPALFLHVHNSNGGSILKNLWNRIKNDVVGGVTAAVVALPLALAFGIASGAGAVAGLYASIFGGLIAAIFGGCGVQITGPTGAMMAVLVSIVGQYGVGGMLLAGALAGLMQIFLGLFRLGGFVKYLPRPVIAGFTNGVSILFFMTAIGDARAAISITIITTIVIIFSLRFLERVPESLFGLVAGSIANELFIHSPHIVGELPFSIPKLAIGIMPFGEIAHLIMPALTICLLGSISALLSAEVTDGMIGVQHNSNRELIGQGLGNIASTLIGGIPVSGAVARSGVNVHSGGRTKLSSILHSVFLLLMILVFSPFVKRIPLASLAAILMVASIRTADWKSLRLIPRASWTYGTIMTITTILTVMKDLTIAVAIGVALAGVVVLIELATLPYKKVFGKKKEIDSLISIRPDIEVIAFHGPLFFVGVENMRKQVKKGIEKAILVLDLSDVPVIDETAALALQDFVNRLQKEGRSIYIGGLNSKPLRMLIRMGVVESLGKLKVCKNLGTAVQRASREEVRDSQNKQVLVS